jgi:hypothetical protein
MKAVSKSSQSIIHVIPPFDTIQSVPGGIGHMLRMTDTMTSQNINLSSSDILYDHNNKSVAEQAMKRNLNKEINIKA